MFCLTEVLAILDGVYSAFFLHPWTSFKFLIRADGKSVFFLVHAGINGESSACVLRLCGSCQALGHPNTWLKIMSTWYSRGRNSRLRRRYSQGGVSGD